ncbi:MAG TPA: pitrilysin family protein, partial [Chthonomonadaceae bacterium]|nr:pitrilysin family protein [Chthonomonadaceae bacterium]
MLLILLLWMSMPACQAAASEPFALPNGLRVLVRERHSRPLVAVDVWVRAGAREESAGEEGCAHCLEHTLFKGTTTRGPGETDAAIESLGGTLDASTLPDAVHFTTTVASSHLGEALRILADVLCNATLPDAEFERERGVILDELARHDSDPSARLVDLLYASAFS